VVTRAEAIDTPNSALLDAREARALRASLPPLRALCDDMRVTLKPVDEWTLEEMERFLGVAFALMRDHVKFDDDAPF